MPVETWCRSLPKGGVHHERRHRLEIVNRLDQPWPATHDDQTDALRLNGARAYEPGHLQTPTHARFQGLAGNSVAGYLDGGTDSCVEDHDQKNRNIPAGQTCPSQNPHFRMVASAGSRLRLEPLRWRPSPSKERSALLTGTPQSSHRARRSGPSERNSSPRRHSRMWNASCPTIFAIPEPAQSFAYDCVSTRDGTAVGLPPHIFRASPK